MRPDFSLIWGSDNAPFTPIEASDYTAGWVFRTGAPPRRVNFDYFQNLSDQRAAWLGEQMLLAVGHEWQDDVTYDAYAITRSPIDGQLYRSLVGGNLNNEPSVSGAEWSLGLVDAPQSTGVAGSFSKLKITTTGLSALATVTADSVSVVGASNASVVLNSVSVTPSLAASGADGLDTGTSAASTWYSVWVIWNGTTTAGLFSLSATAPTLPSGYTHKARVGWVRTDATGNKYPLRIVQSGCQVRYAPLAGTNTTAIPVIAQGIQAAGTAYATGNFIPSTAGVIHGICSPDSSFRSAVGPSAGFYDIFYVTAGGGTPLTNSIFFALVLESTNIYGFQGGAASRTLAYGWEDNL